MLGGEGYWLGDLRALKRLLTAQKRGGGGGGWGEGKGGCWLGVSVLECVESWLFSVMLGGEGYWLGDLRALKRLLTTQGGVGVGKGL